MSDGEKRSNVIALVVGLVSGFVLSFANDSFAFWQVMIAVIVVAVIVRVTLELTIRRRQPR